MQLKIDTIGRVYALDRSMVLVEIGALLKVEKLETFDSGKTIFNIVVQLEFNHKTNAKFLPVQFGVYTIEKYPDNDAPLWWSAVEIGRVSPAPVEFPAVLAGQLYKFT